jgi:hypothetical protein
MVQALWTLSPHADGVGAAQVQDPQGPPYSCNALARRDRPSRSHTLRALAAARTSTGWMMGAVCAERLTYGSARAWGCDPPGLLTSGSPPRPRPSLRPARRPSSSSPGSRRSHLIPHRRSQMPAWAFVDPGVDLAAHRPLQLLRPSRKRGTPPPLRPLLPVALGLRAPPIGSCARVPWAVMRFDRLCARAWRGWSGGRSRPAPARARPDRRFTRAAGPRPDRALRPGARAALPRALPSPR